MENIAGRFRYIFFDADDTLWENERYFRAAERDFALLMSDYAEYDRAVEVLTAKQEENIPLFGYGSKTYLIGMLDAAKELCGDSFNSSIYSSVKDLIARLANHEVILKDSVESVLNELEKEYVLIVATKGDLTEQMKKYDKSGLEKYFRQIEVMHNKDEENYSALARKVGISPSEMLMVGNSVKSDIAPVVNIGGTAIHVPHDIVWVHEMMDMPQSNRIIEVKNIKDLPKILL